MQKMTHEDLANYARKKSKTIALIYSPIELQEYLVEIISKDSEKFIKKRNQNIHFNSVDQALSFATNYGAEEFFLCTDNTYDECGSMGAAQKFDYTPIHSKYKPPKNP